MTVEELINELKQLNQELLVQICADYEGVPLVNINICRYDDYIVIDAY